MCCDILCDHIKTMGKQLVDQFSFLHFCVGGVVYFWGISLPAWLLLHIIFELGENTSFGISIINNYFTFWPGGKPYADSLGNATVDTIAGVIGWIVAKYIDTLGSRKGWYSPHIVN